ncbi:MAG: acyl-CoA dehydratase activase [Syntrophales bacterium]|jgi:predicted CoA-substrate-specific enzyme activase|nr:acyl-CoA dehydratase activase [Syntrophales bacterium]
MGLKAGIDIGSNTAKAAVMEDGRLLGTNVIAAGYNAEAAGRRVLDELLSSLSLAQTDVERIIATGYGRKSVAIADKMVTELMCHATGAHFLDPSVRSLIDIGGQDSKAIVIDEEGRMTNFTMNDKCAAGTGRFLEVMARALEADLNEFGALSLSAEKPAKISSTCTVFAESEVISLIAKGETRENIIAGIHEAIASRVAAMATRIGIRAPVMMTGGVSQNAGVVQALEKALGYPLIVSSYAQLAGAIGAALL